MKKIPIGINQRRQHLKKVQMLINIKLKQLKEIKKIIKRNPAQEIG